MHKHVTLRPQVIEGCPTWRLVGPDGQPIEEFTAFAESLRNLPLNTRKAYCYHLAEFIDYFIEATILLAGERGCLTKFQLTDVLEAYGEYLSLGVDATKPVACLVATSLCPRVNKPSSLTPKKAAIRRFLNLSEAVRKEMVELARSREGGLATASSPVIPELGNKRRIRPSEVNAMQRNSMFAGVIAGGPKLIDCVVLEGASAESQYDSKRAFPFEKAMDFIDALPTYRDKAHYSLLGGAGVRTHESLQALMVDVDIAERTVRFIDPAARPAHKSYLALSPEQRASLAWKGRTTDFALLIEPFASSFFESLQKYLELEHFAHGRHDFLFQYLQGPNRGLPYFLSSYSARLELFKRICKRVGVSLPPGTGPHSFRHMYGTYLLNYFPRPNGEYGMPMPMVQQLLAHSNEKNTRKYAMYDEDRFRLDREYASRAIFDGGNPKSLDELKIEALKAEVIKLENKLKTKSIFND